MPSSDYALGATTQVQLFDLAPGQQAQIKLPLSLLHDRHFDLSSFPINIDVTGSNPSWERNLQINTRHRTNYDLATKALSGPVTNEFDITLRDWSLTRQTLQNYVDSNWEETISNNNFVFTLQEPQLGRDGQVNRAWESPWMQASGVPVTLNFNHSFELTSGEALIEVSENGTDWSPFDVSSTPYSGTSANPPNLIAQSLTNLALEDGDLFKLRFRVAAIAPLTWQFDDLVVAGVLRQPFQEILIEDGKDTTGLCFPIKVDDGAVVVCL